MLHRSAARSPQARLGHTSVRCRLEGDLAGHDARGAVDRDRRGPDLSPHGRGDRGRGIRRRRPGRMGVHDGTPPEPEPAQAGARPHPDRIQAWRAPAPPPGRDEVALRRRRRPRADAPRGHAAGERQAPTRDLRPVAEREHDRARAIRAQGRPISLERAVYTADRSAARQVLRRTETAESRWASRRQARSALCTPHSRIRSAQRHPP